MAGAAHCFVCRFIYENENLESYVSISYYFSRRPVEPLSLRFFSQLNALAEKRKWEKIFCREAALREMLNASGFPFNYHPTLADCDAAITGCEYLVARTGSILLSSAGESGRTVSVYAPIHICIAYTHQVVEDISDGLEKVLLQNPTYPSLLTLATGPSRTADIEKTLVVGVHGPKEVFCFLIDQ